jgi:LuxR family maltose regulon positive regulatory protein
LATKLYLPNPPAAVVARPRVLDALERALARGLTLVCVPAGFGKKARRWTQQRHLHASDGPSYQREGECLVLVRVLLAQDRANDALPLLQRLLAAAVAQGRTGSMIEIEALEALALMASGQDAAAVSTLARTLILAHPRKLRPGICRRRRGDADIAHDASRCPAR